MGELHAAVTRGLREHGTVLTRRFGRVWAYMVDGHVLMDDANAPSLLSIPLIGFAPPSDPTYRATRFDQLRAPPVVNASEAYNATAGNPCFFEEPLRSRGEPALSGVGSLHTGPGKLWPMQGREEVRGLLRMLERVANTTPDGRMVESYSLVMKRSRSKQSRGGGRATAAGSSAGPTRSLSN
uniref:Uncharacterized protein n=1 Tax=Emiliania huxleyi (strain CCMP1516) TaxID=280463 RepID=A0A0D3KF85_EMIH1